MKVTSLILTLVLLVLTSSFVQAYTEPQIGVLQNVTTIEEALVAKATYSDTSPLFYKKGTWVSIVPSKPNGITDPQLVMQKRGAWKLHVYQPPTYQKQVVAIAQPDCTYFYPYHSVTPIIQSENKKLPIFIHVVEGSVDSSIFIEGKADLWQNNQIHLAIISGQRAVMLFIAVLTLFLWLKLNSKVYLLYFLFVMLNAILQSMQDGSLFHILSFDFFLYHAPHIYTLVGATAHVAALSFIKRFLDLRKTLAITDKLLSLAQLISLSILLAPLFGKSYYDLRGIVNIAMLLSSITIVSSTVFLVFWKRNRLAFYGLVGWSVFCIAGITLIMSSMGVIRDNYQDYIYFQLATLLEFVVFQLGLAEMALNYRKERDVALTMASRDKLTNAYNRQGMETLLPEFIERNEKQQIPFSAAILDIDHFKRVNDNYGHDIGDICIKTVAKRVQKQLREEDLLVRFGGEEFVVLLAGTNLHQAEQICIRILNSIGKDTISLPANYPNNSLQITISIGLCEYHQNVGFDGTLKSADDALYHSKRKGRNRLTTSTDLKFNVIEANF